MLIPLHDQNALKRIRLQFVTLGLIAINVLFWLIMATPQFTDATEASAIYYSYGFIPAVINDLADLPVEFVVLPETASYITYAFLHGDFMHLAGNMLFLWVFGDNVEDAMGHLKFIVFYLLCGVIAAQAHSFAVPGSEAPLIGASGAAAGIVGAYLMLHPRVKVWVLALGRIPLRLSAFWVLSAWIAFQIYSFLMNSDSNVSWAAHIGGFAAGAILIVFFKNRNVDLFDKNLRVAESMIPSVKRPIDGNDDSPETPSRSAVNPHRWGRGE